MSFQEYTSQQSPKPGDEGVYHSDEDLQYIQNEQQTESNNRLEPGFKTNEYLKDQVSLGGEQELEDHCEQENQEVIESKEEESMQENVVQQIQEPTTSTVPQAAPISSTSSIEATSTISDIQPKQVIITQEDTKESDGRISKDVAIPVTDSKRVIPESFLSYESSLHLVSAEENVYMAMPLNKTEEALAQQVYAHMNLTSYFVDSKRQRWFLRENGTISCEADPDMILSVFSLPNTRKSMSQIFGEKWDKENTSSSLEPISEGNNLPQEHELYVCVYNTSFVDKQWIDEWSKWIFRKCAVPRSDGKKKHISRRQSYPDDPFQHYYYICWAFNPEYVLDLQKLSKSDKKSSAMKVVLRKNALNLDCRQKWFLKK